MDEGGNPVKGVRLQGFKGFKLNRNAQILYKPPFSKKSSPSKPLENTKLTTKSNPNPSAIVPTSSTVSPASPTFLSKIKLSTAKSTKNSEHKSVMDEIIAEHRKVENVKKLFASLEKSPKKTRLSQLINSDAPPSTPSSERTHQAADKEWQQSKSKPPFHEKIRSQNSSTDHSSREQRPRPSEHTSLHRQSPKRHHQSRNRDNFHQNNSHERRRSRSRERRHSRERRRSRERKHTSRKKSYESKDPRRPASRSYKRKASVSSSSSSSDTTDDDELMRRVREKRMRRSKSPETYFPKKRVRTDTVVEGTKQHEHRNEEKIPNKSVEKHKIKIVGAPTDRLPDVTKTTGKETNSISPKDKTKTEKVKSSNSIVPLASIGCWVSEEEDNEYEVPYHQEGVKSPTRPDESDESSSTSSSDSTSEEERNAFDSLTDAELSVGDDKATTVESSTSSPQDRQQVKEEDDGKIPNETSFTDIPKSVSSNNCHDSSLLDFSNPESENQTNFPNANDQNRVLLDETVASVQQESSRIVSDLSSKTFAIKDDDLDRNNSFLGDVADKSVAEASVPPPPRNPGLLENNEEGLSKLSCHESEDLFEKMQPDLSDESSDKVLKTLDNSNNKIAEDSNATSVLLESSEPPAGEGSHPPEPRNRAPAVVSSPPKQETLSQCRTSFVHPAKKRYHEWFKSMSQEPVTKTEPHPASNGASGVQVADPAAQEDELPIQQCTVDTTVPVPVVEDGSSDFKAKQLNLSSSLHLKTEPENASESASGGQQTSDDAFPRVCLAATSLPLPEPQKHSTFEQARQVANPDTCIDNSTLSNSHSSGSIQGQLDTSLVQTPSHRSPSTSVPSTDTPPRPPLLPKKRALSVSDRIPSTPPLPSETPAVLSRPLEISDGTSTLGEPQQQPTSMTRNDVLPGQSSPESPLFCLGQDSPGPAYTLSDGDSCYSDMDDLPPVEIRIPIDNEESMDCEPAEEKPEKKGIASTPHHNAVAENEPADELEAHFPANETANDRAASDGSIDDNAEARRRSTRIKTKMKKKPVYRASSLPTPSGDTTANEATKTSEGSTLLARDHVAISQPISVAKPPATEEEATDESISPPLFDAITENVYLFDKKKSRARKEIRRMLCECISNTEEGKPPCGESCLNRLLMIECSARCPFGEICTNKMFQRRQYLPTEVFQTSWKGWGLRAAEFLPPGKLVMEYCGEVLDPPEFYRRSQMYAEKSQQHFYFMALSQDEIIDATYKGNSSRFINHSCDPNCETQKWTVNGRLRVGFFTLKEIPKGEEITFDYQFARYGKEAQICYCGSSNCRGYLGKPPSDDDDVTAPWGVGHTVAEATYDVEGGKEKKAKARKEKYQEFKENALESEISRLSGGLKTTKEVLLLSRLMVRSDTVEERMMCLKVLRRSDNQNCLRSFLHFHGLPLVWSWMVDVSGNLSAPSSAPSPTNMRLKAEILNTLAMLPITNKNILEDSKVLSMVKRWSEEESNVQEEEEEKALRVQDDHPKLNESVAENKDDESTKSIPDQVDSNDKNKDGNTSGNESTTENNESENIEKSPEPEDSTKVPTCLEDATKRENEDKRREHLESSHKVLSLTAHLLASWKDLKEIYRIPKKTVEKPTLGGDSERSVDDRTNSQTSSPSLDVFDTGRARDEREKSPHRSRAHYEREHSRDGERYRSRDLERERRSRRSPRSKWKEEEGSKVKLSALEANGKLSWLYNSESSHPSRLSRKEHRLQFERDMRQKDEMKNEIREIVNKALAMKPQVTSITSVPAITPPAVQPTVTPKTAVDPLVHAPDSVTFTPSGYSGNLIQINPTPVTPSPILYPGGHEQPQQPFNFVATQPMMQATPAMPSAYISSNPQQGKPISVIGAPQPLPQVFSSSTSLLGDPYTIHQQVAQNMQLSQAPPTVPPAGVTILGYQGDNAIVLLSPDQLKELTEMLALKSMQQQTVMQPSVIAQPQALMQPAILQQPPLPQSPIPIAQHPVPVAQSGVPIAQSVVPIAQSVVPIAQSAVPIAQSVVPIVQSAVPVAQSSVPVAQSESAMQLSQFETQPPMELPLAAQSAFNPTPPSRDPSETRSITGSAKSPPRDPRPPRLPPNWKTASDADGCVYYYHAITRQTQWEAPTWDGSEEDMVGKKGADMEISTPTHEEESKKTDIEKLSSAAVIASGAEQAKKAKETFRKAMSHHVVNCLGAYRKSDCKVGRITSTEEFKKLARKLTHNILQKEIKQVQVWEDLECNANVKHKAKEYVRKYMAKMGPVCKTRDEDNPK